MEKPHLKRQTNEPENLLDLIEPIIPPQDREVVDLIAKFSSFFEKEISAFAQRRGTKKETGMTGWTGITGWTGMTGGTGPTGI
jgi:hypothetical protein